MKKSIALLLSLVMLLATCGTAFASSGQMLGTEVLAEGQAVALKIAEEGDVLVKNDNNSLPISADTKVNVFGASSLDAFYGGGGSGSVTVTGDADFYSALTKAGIRYNTELHDAYAEWYRQYQEDTSYLGSGGATGQILSTATNAEWDIINDQYDEDGNIRRAKMDASILKNAEEYSETAIVFIARSGSEGADLSQADLELRESEVAMLAYVTSNYDNVIVIFNICNVMEMGWLEGGAEFTYTGYTYGIRVSGGCNPRYENHHVDYDEPHTYTIGECDSALIIWAPGEAGMEAVGEILTGEVNPSARLADTIAYDIDSNPTTRNFGSTPFAGTNTPMNVYEEGIYVGYLYYETFAPEAVQYPFGYGLSYTTFAWSDFEYAKGENQYGEETIVATVKVTNTGDAAGKDVVELYYTQPYYADSQYKIEKALVNLGAFAKTSELAPGASETVTLTLNVRDMASWSETVSAYVLENGAYTISIAADSNKAHTAPANTYTYNVAETVIYDKDEVTGTEYASQFGYGEGIGEVTEGYMHRIDVDGVPTVEEGTYPESPDGTETSDFAKIAEQYGTYYYKDYSNFATPDFSEAPRTSVEDAATTGAVYYDENGNVDVYTLQEVYNDLKAEDANEDEIWDKFLDQLSIYDMFYLTEYNGYMTAGLEQYGIPPIGDQDGPAAIRYASKVAHPEGTLNGQGCAYPVETCLCCTWNVEMAAAWGSSTADQAIAIDSYGWYAPANNIHRSPMSGRNFEYLSEDSYLAGTMCGNIIKACEDKGVVCYLKHFALNDQETDRMGIATYAHEQAVREVYLEAFEIAVKTSKVSAIMSSFNRIGIIWSGANPYLLNNVLRDEWGFEGVVLTDYYVGGYMNPTLAILNGGDMLLDGSNITGMTVNSRTGVASVSATTNWELDYYAIDPVGMTDALRTGVKNLCIKDFETGAFTRTLSEDWEFGVTGNRWYTTVTVGNDTVETTLENPTATIELPVTISGNEGITAALFTFSGIDLTGAEVEANFGDLEYNNTAENLRVIWWNESGSLTDDLMFTITLDYENGTLATGRYPISVVITGAQDRLVNDYTSLYCVAGSVTIKNEYAKGDVTQDGSVDNRDLIMIARYLVDLVQFNAEQLEAADYNNDGNVTNADLVLIARAIVNA
jgi:beta-glucosidase